MIKIEGKDHMSEENDLYRALVDAQARRASMATESSLCPTCGATMIKSGGHYHCETHGSPKK